MTLDPYALCPCGSGKKFKWCCQPFYKDIDRAFTQLRNGQDDAAVKIMDQIVQDHPNVAEVWGRRAELYWELNQRDEADKSLDKALELQPHYATAYLLRGMLRHEEGEIPGALLLYRKATEYFDPSAREQLAEAWFCVGQCEVMLNRPLAVRAAWQIALNLQPANDVVQKSLQKYFEPGSPYPRLARKAWSFRTMAPDAGAHRAQAWEKARGAAATGKLTDALNAFEQLTAEAPTDPDAWFNLGLCRAWVGDNAAAVEALDQCVSAETDDDRAAEAWAVAEVLRFGHGMEESCDWAERMAAYQILDFQKLGATLKNDRRFTDLRQMENGSVGGVVIERPMPAAHPNLALFELPKLLAYFAVANNSLLLQTGNAERLQQARQLVESSLGAAVEFREEAPRAPEFVRTFQMMLDLRLPSGLTEDVAAKLMREAIVQYLEETWPRQPLRSLGMITPLDAVGHAVLRRKVSGLVNFIDDLTHSYVPLPYNVDRLRHKLGLPIAGGESPAEVSGQPVEISAMSAAELAALKADELSDADVELAMQAARRLAVPELAGKFARALIARPNNAKAPDRFAAFNHLIQLALEADQPEEALGLVEAGMKHDCEHNEGRRRNDYDLRGAQIHLKAGQPEQAHLAFCRLVERLPSDCDLLGKASEGMLRANRRAEAAEFAAKGVAAARAKGDKDRLGYFEELLEAAKR